MPNFINEHYSNKDSKDSKDSKELDVNKVNKINKINKVNELDNLTSDNCRETIKRIRNLANHHGEGFFKESNAVDDNLRRLLTTLVYTEIKRYEKRLLDNLTNELSLIEQKKDYLLGTLETLKNKFNETELL